MIMKKVLKTFSSASFIAAARFLLTCSLGAKIMYTRKAFKQKKIYIWIASENVHEK